MTHVIIKCRGSVNGKGDFEKNFAWISSFIADFGEIAGHNVHRCFLQDWPVEFITRSCFSANWEHVRTEIDLSENSAHLNEPLIYDRLINNSLSNYRSSSRRRTCPDSCGMFFRTFISVLPDSQAVETCRIEFRNSWKNASVQGSPLFEVSIESKKEIP